MPIVRKATKLVQAQVVVFIYRALLAGKSMIENGEHETSVINKVVANLIATEPLLKLDYVAICDPNTFEEMGKILEAK